MKVIYGKKFSMTQIFTEDGEAKAVTIIKTVPVKFYDRITTENRGYDAIKCKISTSKKEKIVEFRSDDKDYSDFKKGDSIDESQFSPGDIVNITSKSKGKGFTGTVKRYGFAKGPETHGSNQQRRQGSIGAAYPQHVLKGQKMPGRMGYDQITVKNLIVMDVDTKNHMLLLSGAVPGSKNTLVKIVGK